jgi:hypothetical protein
MYVSIGAGAIAGALVEWLGGKFEPALIACVIATCAVETTRALSYVEPEWADKRTLAALPIRRRLVWSAVSAAALLIIRELAIPHREALAFERKLRVASANPADPKNIGEAKLVLAGARAARVPIEPLILEETGEKFVKASAQYPAAWDVALESLTYKSFVSNRMPALPHLRHYDVQFHEDVQFYEVTPTGLETPDFSSWGAVPRSEAAQYNLIGHDWNMDRDTGVAGLFVTGGAQILDAMQLKNVVFQGVEIHYAGGRVLLTNVLFVNCKFKIQSAPRSRNLAFAILSPGPSTTFSGE